MRSFLLLFSSCQFGKSPLDHRMSCKAGLALLEALPHEMGRTFLPSNCLEITADCCDDISITMRLRRCNNCHALPRGQPSVRLGRRPTCVPQNVDANSFYGREWRPAMGSTAG